MLSKPWDEYGQEIQNVSKPCPLTPSSRCKYLQQFLRIFSDVLLHNYSKWHHSATRAKLSVRLTSIPENLAFAHPKTNPFHLVRSVQSPVPWLSWDQHTMLYKCHCALTSSAHPASNLGSTEQVPAHYAAKTSSPRSQKRYRRSFKNFRISLFRCSHYWMR